MSCVDILHLSSIWPFLLRSCLIFYSYTLSSTLLSLLSWTNCLSWHHKLSVACSSCKFHVFSKCDSQRLRYCFVWLHVQTSAVNVSKHIQLLDDCHYLQSFHHFMCSTLQNTVLLKKCVIFWLLWWSLNCSHKPTNSQGLPLFPWKASPWCLTGAVIVPLFYFACIKCVCKI